MMKELGPKGAAILTVNGGDSAAVVAKFWNESHLTLPVALDSAGAVAKKYGVQAIPTNYVIGADGKILGAFEGFDEAGIRAALTKAGVK
jgi:peroxiredoxin